MSNRVKELRLSRNWTQAELAEQAGVSRAAISAIESERLVPAVTTALSLATVFGCSVEELFGKAREVDASLNWAWQSAGDTQRFWRALVRGRQLAYPVEPTASGLLEHDGLYHEGHFQPSGRFAPEKTLVMACCDPAASLLAVELMRQADVRLIVLPRSSREALRLLGLGLVHAAGVHLSGEQEPDNNAKIIKESLGENYRLLRMARWEEGLAFSSTFPGHSIRQILRAHPRVVGRELGSGARQCLDEVMGHRPAPTLLANSHHGVVEAIRSGWADVGPCLRLTAEDAGLSFLSVRKEVFELCFSAEEENDPRIRALIAAVRSAAWRRLYGELPGYELSESGEVREIKE